MLPVAPDGYAQMPAQSAAADAHTYESGYSDIPVISAASPAPVLEAEMVSLPLSGALTGYAIMPACDTSPVAAFSWSAAASPVAPQHGHQQQQQQPHDHRHQWLPSAQPAFRRTGSSEERERELDQLLGDSSASANANASSRRSADDMDGLLR